MNDAIVDSICNRGEGNSAQDLQQVADHLLELNALGIVILFSHFFAQCHV